MLVAVGMAGAVGGCGDECLDAGQQLSGVVGEQVGDDALPDIFDGLRSGMGEVVGIETVVAQVVDEDFAGGEIPDRVGESAHEFVGGEAQHGLAHGVSGQPVGQVPHRTDRDDDLLAGQGPLDEACEDLDNLIDTEPSAYELRGGLPVTVGHHGAVMFEDPGGAEGEDHAVGAAKRLGAVVPGAVHAVEGLLGRRGGEVAVEVEVTPEVAVEEELAGGDGGAVGEAFEGRGNRERIEKHAGGVGVDAELGACEAVGDGGGEARPEGEDPVFVSDAGRQGGGFDFGAEFHTAKIENSYLCCMILKANCKINLGLDILRRRPDGYHDLATVMVPVTGLFDEVEVTRAEGGEATFAQEGLLVDCPAEANLCLRAWRLMRDRYGIGGVHIRLDKRVPFGAGLGGGSSDATAVVRAVNTLYGLELTEAELIARAAELGSDTAFFVRNTPQLCTGRGEVMTPCEVDLRGLTLAVVKPAEGVSTREAYAGVRPRIPQVPLAERLRRPLGEWQATVTNAFEASVFAAHPAIRAVKERLLAAGARYASMSGSGSAVFGLFETAQPTIPLHEGEFLHCERID